MSLSGLPASADPGSPDDGEGSHDDAHDDAHDEVHGGDHVGVLGLIGAGPKGLSALLALDDELAARPWPGRGTGARGEMVRVEVWEPGTPGAGAVWDPAQPEHLILNVDVALVDYTATVVPWDYRRWAQHHDEVVEDGFPARAHVGGYLAWVWERLLTSPRLAIRRHPLRAEEVTAHHGRWRIRDARGATEVDHVLLATGHRGGIGLDHAAITADRQRYRADAEVVVRGAALTGIDTVLDLTAGRGGTWLATPGTRSGLTYQRSGAEPRHLMMTSRSGLLLRPKPEVPLPIAEALVHGCTGPLRQATEPDDDWWATLWDAAVTAAASCGITLDSARGREVLDGREPVTDQWQVLADDLRRGRGRVDDDPAWWWGRVWSWGYRDLIQGLERGPRDPELWSRWRQRAARLERWAFGPPAQTVRRLLALHDAGLLDVASTQDPGRAAPDIVAITAGPGILGALEEPDGSDPTDRLWTRLARAGWVSVRAGERGVLTTPDGFCVGNDGPTRRLAAVGRPTEDPVIGHDTLSRTLHGDIARWAASVADDLCPVPSAAADLPEETRAS